MKVGSRKKGKRAEEKREGKRAGRHLKERGRKKEGEGEVERVCKRL